MRLKSCVRIRPWLMLIEENKTFLAAINMDVDG